MAIGSGGGVGEGTPGRSARSKRAGLAGLPRAHGRGRQAPARQRTARVPCRSLRSAVGLDPACCLLPAVLLCTTFQLQQPAAQDALSCNLGSGVSTLAARWHCRPCAHGKGGTRESSYCRREPRRARDGTRMAQSALGRPALPCALAASLRPAASRALHLRPARPAARHRRPLFWFGVCTVCGRWPVGGNITAVGLHVRARPHSGYNCPEAVLHLTLLRCSGVLCRQARAAPLCWDGGGDGPERRRKERRLGQLTSAFWLAFTTLQAPWSGSRPIHAPLAAG